VQTHDKYLHSITFAFIDQIQEWVMRLDGVGYV